MLLLQIAFRNINGFVTFQHEFCLPPSSVTLLVNADFFGVFVTDLHGGFLTHFGFDSVARFATPTSNRPSNAPRIFTDGLASSARPAAAVSAASVFSSFHDNPPLANTTTGPFVSVQHSNFNSSTSTLKILKKSKVAMGKGNMGIYEWENISI